MVGISMLMLFLCEIGLMYFSSDSCGVYTKNAGVWRWVFGVGFVLSFVCLVLFAALEVLECGI